MFFCIVKFARNCFAEIRKGVAMVSLHCEGYPQWLLLKLHIVTCLDVWAKQTFLFGILGLNKDSCLGFKAKQKFLSGLNRGSCLG